MNETCAKCGHESPFHIKYHGCIYGLIFGKDGIVEIGCQCKKFEPQNNSPIKESGTSEGKEPDENISGSDTLKDKGIFDTLKDKGIFDTLKDKGIFDKDCGDTIYIDKDIAEYLKKLKDEFGDYHIINVDNFNKLLDKHMGVWA